MFIVSPSKYDWKHTRFVKLCPFRSQASCSAIIILVMYHSTMHDGYLGMVKPTDIPEAGNVESLNNTGTVNRHPASREPTAQLKRPIRKR